jgi:hypothetical protein
MQRIGAKAYEAGGGPSEPGSGDGTDGAGPAGGEAAGDGEAAGEEETIEGEYKEV